MFAADYLCDIAVRCRTCDVVGNLTAAGTQRVQRLVREHRDCDVSIDVTNLRAKRKRFGMATRVYS